MLNPFNVDQTIGSALYDNMINTSQHIYIQPNSSAQCSTPFHY